MRAFFASLLLASTALAQPKSDSAAVELVLFIDIEEPASKALVPVVRALETRYGRKLTVRWIVAPITDKPFSNAWAFTLLDAARRQGKFAEMLDELFLRQEALPLAKPRWFAEALQLDLKLFDADFAGKEVPAAVVRQAEAAFATGVLAAPAAFVNGLPTPSLEQLTALIDGELTLARAKSGQGAAWRTQRTETNNLPLERQLRGGGKELACQGLAQCADFCARRDFSACNTLGSIHLEGRGVQTNRVEGLEWFKKACAGNNGPGCFNLAGFYARGESVTQDEQVATDYFIRSCVRRWGPGCAEAARRTRDGVGHPVDPALTLRFSRLGCGYAGPDACLHYGWIEDGKNTGNEEQLAAAAFRIACDAGRALACNQLGWLLAGGGVGVAQGGVAPDETLAFPLFQKACDLNESAGCANLGWRIERGIATPKDPNKAADVFEKSCELGWKWSCGEACRLGRKNRCGK